MINNKKQNQAFTLVELAIVIVIIGLLVGGVLQGQELIRQSGTKKIITDIETYSAATVLFKDKYGQLPGDFTRAEAIWGSDTGCPNTAYNTVLKTATCNGSGDNIIGNLHATPTQEYEMFRYWQHLSNAKMIKGIFTGSLGPNAWTSSKKNVNIPTTSFDALIAIMSFQGYIAWAPMFNGTYYNFFAIGAESVNEPLNPFLTPTEAFQIDTKMDDGKPGQGKLRTRTASYMPNCTNGEYTDGATATYTMTVSDKTCNLFYINNF